MAKTRQRTAVSLGDYDVYEATHDRLRWLYKEFDGKVAVTFSGGKDSTIVLEIAARVSMELGYGPAIAWFLDQEAEFQSTVDYMRQLRDERDDIDLRWYRVSFPMENSMNLDDPWFQVWGEDDSDVWMREKEPGAITENVYDRKKTFYKLLDSIARHDFPGYALLDGMRAEESPTRRVSMTSAPQYKWVTWSAVKRDDGGCRFHPIWDWSYRDVWKAIYDNDWPYNKHYDNLFRYGTPTKNMRVSSFTHVMSTRSIQYLQEMEPETWERALQRYPGISALSQLSRRGQMPKELPYMFNSWNEYMVHLNENLIRPEDQDSFRKQYKMLARAFPEEEESREFAPREICGAIIWGDVHATGTKRMISSKGK